MSPTSRFYYGFVDEDEHEELGIELVGLEQTKIIQYINRYRYTEGYCGQGFRRLPSGKGIRYTSIKEAVYDGDTVTLGGWGNISTRFLGVDTAEKRFRLLRSRTEAAGSRYVDFVSLDDPKWANFLADPFTLDSSDYLGAGNGAPLPEYRLSAGLRQHLQDNLVPEAAMNHSKHAAAARDHLEALTRDDLENLVNADGSKRFESEQEFRFYLRFAFEIMDGYGRLLCVLKPDEPDPPGGQRRQSYNLRMLEAGMATPYFIWPNLEPWRSQELLQDAVVRPGEAHDLAEAPGSTFKRARDYVRDARDGNLGIFGPLPDGEGPLMLMPHEIRFLASRRAPPRYVIDLGGDPQWTDTILAPENYYLISNLEDRLYIPSAYVPFFVQEAGWNVQEPEISG